MKLNIDVCVCIDRYIYTMLFIIFVLRDSSKSHQKAIFHR